MWLPRAGVPLATTRLLLLLAALLAAAGVVVVEWLRPGSPVDLAVYLSGARALLHGTDVTAAHPANSLLPFTYPPFAALLFVPLLAVPVRAASLAMTAGSVTALVYVSQLALRHVRPQWTPARVWAGTAAVTAAALALDPVWDTIALGQVNLVLLAMVLGDLLGPADRRGRGALIGLAAGIKLTPAIFVPYLLVTGQFRAARTAIATGLGTVLVGLAMAPTSTVRFWTRLVFDPAHVGGIPYAGNQSLYAVTTRLGRGQEPLRWVWILAVATVVIVGLATARRLYRAGNQLAAGCLVGLTGLLISPVSWNHHWVWLVPAAVALWSVRWWLPAGLLAIFTLAPIWWVPRGGNKEYGAYGVQLVWGNAYVLAGLVVFAAVVVAAFRTTAVAGPRLVEGREQRLGQVRGQVVSDQQLILGLVRPAEADRGGAGAVP